MGDEGYIAQELLDGMSPEWHLEQVCKTVESVVKEGIFTLEEALSLYEVLSEDYDLYLKNKEIENKYIKEDD